MNRLIIIGNGFDLAHGINSSFKGFILNYIANSINTFYSEQIYEDSLLKIRNEYEYVVIQKEKITDPTTAIDELNKLRTNPNCQVISHGLLQNILLRLSLFNWVDIEIEYFNMLNQCNSYTPKKKKDSAIEILNNQFKCLRHKLIQHLTNNQEHSYNSEQLYQSMIEGMKAVPKHPERNSQLVFLNFNYTKTAEWYLDRCTREHHSASINYIHGSLCEKFGKPIFGFGDELNKKYKEFEDQENKQLFKFIKSFDYLQNRNYSNLMKYIDHKDFEVYIYGHSCGLSDRTLLNTIFENPKCKSIKVFYYESEGSNDYTDKIYDIARHFKDKVSFRDKVVNFKDCQPMSQPTLELIESN